MPLSCARTSHVSPPGGPLCVAGRRPVCTLRHGCALDHADEAAPPVDERPPLVQIVVVATPLERVLGLVHLVRQNRGHVQTRWHTHALVDSLAHAPLHEVLHVLGHLDTFVASPLAPVHVDVLPHACVQQT